MDHYKMRAVGLRSINGSRWLSGAVFGFAAMIIGASGVVTTAEAVPRRVKRACKGDYKTLCPHYKAGTSRMRACMRSNGSQLSWGCYQALKDHGYVRGGRRR